METTRLCFSCKTYKEIGEFGRSTHNLSGYKGSCYECLRVYNRKKYSENRDERVAKSREWSYLNRKKCTDRRREYNRRRMRSEPDYLRFKRIRNKYGITKEQYVQKSERQGNVCKICGGVNPDGRPLFVDHCHKTGKVRDLLCGTCNLTLGRMKESVKHLSAMIGYIVRWSGDI